MPPPPLKLRVLFFLDNDASMPERADRRTMICETAKRQRG
jgi:hypothetical protein